MRHISNGIVHRTGTRTRPYDHDRKRVLSLLEVAIDLLLMGPQIKLPQEPRPIAAHRTRFLAQAWLGDTPSALAQVSVERFGNSRLLHNDLLH